MADDLQVLHTQLKIEKNLKGETSRQFKNVEKDSAEHQGLLTRMQEISNRIKTIEAQIKLLESSAQATTKSEPDNLRVSVPVPAPFTLIDEKNRWEKDVTYKIIPKDQMSRWDLFLLHHKASGYHQSHWFDLIKISFGHDTRILIAEDNEGNILGGLPLTFFSSKLFGKFAISIPYVNYGGVVSHYFDITQKLISEVQDIHASEGLSHIEIRTMQSGLAQNSLDKKVSMVFELPSTDDELEKSLGSKIRAQYKKAETYSPSVKFGKLELLDDFYKVFARNMRDLGTPVYSKTWFENILKETKIKSALIVVYMESKPVSTGFLVGNNNILEIPWASTVQSANAKNANMWMYRQILSYAINEKYQFFDFGRSTLGAGTYKFKKQWGALAYAHHWYYVLPEGETKPELNPDNPKYKLVIFLWKLMPVWLTKIVGPQIIKHIP
ncbi:MAG: FemAB family XrtA/PEP-CTERM system-associated protein [Cellvibrio sp.]